MKSVLKTSIALALGTLIALPAFAADKTAEEIRADRTTRFAAQTQITTVDGVAQYPKGYQGTAKRSVQEDPFLSPENSMLILIDYQPPILQGVNNIDHKDLINNATGLIKTAVIYDIPIIFSHVAVGLNGYAPMIDELKKLAPNATFIDRTNVNAWEEPEFVKAVEATGRKKLIMGGLWTDVCLAYPAIEAEREGYDVYVPEDVVGSFTQTSHENGMRRMIAAGVEPITWNVVPAEFQRDHARTDKLQAITRVFMEYLFKLDPDATWQ
ncbi:hydrolase [Pseudovibrio sp. Tun.PSC04-5.I4]|uniref:hydrolase n=1 Tax=Pseudovibrio sp. Tun.PSC04-5.I4 TaxID=1798213 RepID=UPI0008825368|nr:hydrolase [Pseudovibrio sp. Tun.PSC04-5.I4]SDR32332.1 Nicotinamidase-related amidase [Pseudovibrio sp. Tun.PSC04-5.I4]